MISDFEYKKYREIKRLSLEELNKYYRQLRKYEFENNKPLESSKIKKKIHTLSMLILKIDRLLSNRKLIIYDDKRDNYKELDRGKIYASSHVGRYDIESTMEAIDDQAYFVMGDPEETYRNFEGFYLNLIQKQKNGENLSDSDKKLIEEYKIDRNLCQETCIRRVKNKDNILIYPEGAWNITPKLTQPLFKGTARIAVRGDGIIIPVGIIRDNKKYIVNIGKNFDVSGAGEKDIDDITTELKEKINSLKGEIIFSNDKIMKRSSMKSPKENEREFKEDIMRETTNGYTEEVIEKSRYYDKDAPENVFKVR